MGSGLSLAATQRLTQAAFELLPRRSRRRYLRWAAVAALGLAAGLGAGWLAWGQAVNHLPALSAAVNEAQQLRQRLEQSRLTLQVSEARGQELERQIEALTRRLQESQEELSFFRKTRDGKRH